jgi:ATP-dependent helicase/nuclease subunit B
MTSGSRPGSHVYTIPSGVAFLPSLVRAVLDQGFPVPGRFAPSAVELSAWTILVPTRRTARELSRVFLNQLGLDAVILPCIRSLGDVDEDEHLFNPADETDPAIPPAISATARQFLLARLISEWAAANPATGLARALSGFSGQVFALARSLGQLVDNFETEEVSLDAIERLMGADFAEHRLAMLDFLAIVRKRLPESLAERGLLGFAARRSLLLRREARRLETAGTPVIAAGSTGSIRATADLLRSISRMEKGAVVLPGLDLHMDEESWAAVADEPGHPQFGLKLLLSILGVERSSVEVYPGVSVDRAGNARLWLAGEIMRPAQATEGWWRNLRGRSQDIRSALQGLEVIEAADQREEARVIATIMRHSLETPGRTARLITPDRRLARRVRAELRRWNIEIDDSGGLPCLQTPAGAFLRLILDLGLSRLNAREFAALLKHPLLRLGRNLEALAGLVGKLEVALLRGAVEPCGLNGLRELLALKLESVSSDHSNLERIHPSLRRLRDQDWRDIADFVDRFARTATPFLNLLAENNSVPLPRLVHAHLECAEMLSTDPTGESLLWRGEDGEALSRMFANLIDHADEAPELSPSDYGALITGELALWKIASTGEGHPRLSIMGLLEARLLSADVVVLGGLNHGLWPAEAQIDPWLSRPMRAEVNLASPDRTIGLSAHDFVQNFAATGVFLTWSRKIDGVPTLPSRWVTRLEAVLNAACVRSRDQTSMPWLAWASALDSGEKRRGARQPRPRPPLEARPASLSVTRIEKLIANPYFLYAERVLGLEPLEPLSKKLDAADRGNLVHQALRSFVETYSGEIAGDAIDRLIDCGRQVFTPWFYDPQVPAFWWPQFERIAHWFIEQERQLRANSKAQLCECAGRAVLKIAGQDFTITARADRIDMLTDGSLRIIDYKTGELPTYTAVDDGHAPQLPLEAWLAEQGAFSNCAAAPVSELLFLRLRGGQIPGEIRPAGKAVPKELAAASHSGLARLLLEYASLLTPYVALDTDAGGTEPGGPHHLARTQEWLATENMGKLHGE